MSGRERSGYLTEVIRLISTPSDWIAHLLRLNKYTITNNETYVFLKINWKILRRYRIPIVFSIHHFFNVDVEKEEDNVDNARIYLTGSVIASSYQCVPCI